MQTLSSLHINTDAHDETPPEVGVALRIFGNDLDPDAVTKALQLSPDHLHRVGDRPNGDAKYAAYKHAMWLLNSKLSREESLEAHLTHLLSLLEPKQAQIALFAKIATVDFSCDLHFVSGFSLSPQLVNRLAHLCVGLSVTVW